MKHPERVQEYLEHIAQSLDRATTYVQHLEDLAASNKIRVTKTQSCTTGTTRTITMSVSV